MDRVLEVKEGAHLLAIKAEHERRPDHARRVAGCGFQRHGAAQARHAGDLAEFLGYVAAPLTWRTEVPLPNAGDARGWDAVIAGFGKRTGVEYERALRDAQAQSRRIALKRRDGGVDHLLVLLADTRANRTALRDSPTFLPELPRTSKREVLDAHPAISVAPEGLFVMNLLRSYRRGAWSNDRVRRFATHLFFERRMRRWSIDRGVLEQRWLNIADPTFARMCARRGTATPAIHS